MTQDEVSSIATLPLKLSSSVYQSINLSRDMGVDGGVTLDTGACLCLYVVSNVQQGYKMQVTQILMLTRDTWSPVARDM